MTDTAARVRKIVIEHLDCDPALATDDADFVDALGADSLDLVEIVLALEEEFDVSIPDDKAESIKTLGQAVTYVTELLGAPA